MKKLAVEKESDLAKKARELEDALKEQRDAAQAIKDASSQTASLSQVRATVALATRKVLGSDTARSQAKAELEGKIGLLEQQVQDANSAGSGKV